MKQKFYS